MRLAIIPPTIGTKMVFIIIKFLQCLRVMEYLDKGLLRPSTLSLTISECIIVVTMLEVDLGIKIPATISISIKEFIILMLVVEV